MEKIALADLDVLAQNVLAQLGPLASAQDKSRATLVALQGDLGAGKTTFTQALARQLGVVEVVQSPTYVLMKSYPINYKGLSTLIHIDAYRLDAPEQFAALNPNEFLDNPNNLVVVEWPERLQGVLPTPDLVLNFSSQDAAAGERYIEVV